jgi:hypothetical protein
MGGGAGDGSWAYKETWWEKADSSGFKELGAEKSGYRSEGDAWWETWREVSRPGEGGAAAGPASLEKSADKWARDGDSREWHEQWWERYGRDGGCEKGARKSGRAQMQAWWETWGERHAPDGGVLKWTDKWAEGGPSGARWGDKWEERFAAQTPVAWGGPPGQRSRTSAGGAKQGETWRVSPSGERWSRTWGEQHGADGGVRKYGRSTSGEAWDALEPPAPSRYAWSAPMGWAEVVGTAQQLLAISTPPLGREEWRTPGGGAAAPPPAPGGAWSVPAVKVPPPPPPPNAPGGEQFSL